MRAGETGVKTFFVETGFKKSLTGWKGSGEDSSLSKTPYESECSPPLGLLGKVAEANKPDITGELNVKILW